jgi:hypothetical protein
LSADNEAGASSNPPLLAITDGHADVGIALPGGEDHSVDDGQDVQSLSVGDSDSDSTDSDASNGSFDSAEAKKGKGTKRAVVDNGTWVGINDEAQYMDDQQQGQVEEPVDSDSNEHDDLLVDDEAGCQVSQHVTNLENPTIALGVTFEDGDTFKRAIRQYAVRNEFKIAAPYSEKTRYRGYCKGKNSKKKKCKWRIHASQLPDGRTWQVCNIQCLSHVCCCLFC